MVNQLGLWSPINIALFFLRAFSALALIYYQGLTQLIQGWNFVWHNSSWPLVDYFSQSHSVPVSTVFALLTAVFYFFAPMLLMLGFLTRFSAAAIFIGLVATLNMGFEQVLSSSLHTQTLVIYFVVSLFLMITGGGAFSIDRLFVRKKTRRTASSVSNGLYA